MPKAEIIPSITVGFLVWIFISTSIIEGANCLLNDTNSIQNMRLPISFYSLLSLSKQLINFVHSLLIILLVSFVYPPEKSANGAMGDTWHFCSHFISVFYYNITWNFIFAL